MVIRAILLAVILVAHVSPLLAHGAIISGQSKQGGEPVITDVMFNQSSAEDARKLGVESCAKKGNLNCRVVQEFSSTCFVLYYNKKTGRQYYQFSRDTRQSFEALASQCRSAYRDAYYDCYPSTPFCDSPEGIQDLLRQRAAVKANEEQLARQQEEARRREEQARREAAEKESRKQIATAECAKVTSVHISGGPWFSTTYKVAALDRVKQLRAMGDFLCVKSVEFVSDAPNPFGGKAARARFIGFSSYDYHATIQVQDFMY